MTGRTNKARASEIVVRVRAMAAARAAFADNTSLAGVAQQTGASHGLIKHAATVLRYGTPEEIASAEAGEVSLVVLGKSIQRRVPREQRPRRPQGFYGEDVREGRKLDIKLWEQINTVLDTLGAMPQPADVIRSVRKHHRRVNEVERKLATAYAWLEEFSDAWTK